MNKSGIWMLSQEFAQQVDGHDPSAMFPMMVPMEPVAPYSVDGNVAFVEVQDVLTKCGFYGTSTAAIVDAVADIAEDDGIDIVVFRIDSPGGAVAGIQDVAEAIRELGDRKRTIAFVEDFAASAAYWIASQCQEIIANQPTAFVGSIGAYCVLVDASERMDSMGFKIHVISSGERKGDGVYGTPVSDEMVADAQSEINLIHDYFVAEVATGRKVSAAVVDTWADGRMYPAEVALQMGLIDSIQSWAKVLRGLDMSSGNGATPADNGVTNVEFATTEPSTETTVAASEPAPVEPPVTPTEETVAEAIDERAELARFMDTFGSARGAEMYCEGVNFDTALVQRFQELQAENEKLREQIKQLDASERDPVSSPDTESATVGKGLKGRVNIVGRK